MDIEKPQDLPFPKIALLLLAAGNSSRMGEASKQLLPVGNQLLIQKTVYTLLRTKLPCYVVLGAYQEAHQKALEGLPVSVICNLDWAKGMGNSLKFGLRSIPTTYDSILVAVVDQPFLSVEFLDRLIDTYQKDPTKVVASGYSDTFGVPVIFNRRYEPIFLTIPDAAGGKKAIKRLSAHLVLEPFDQGAFDIDTKEDYQRLLGLG